MSLGAARRTALASAVLLFASCSVAPPEERKPQDYVLFFTGRSTVLDRSAIAVVEAAAATARARPNQDVLVEGFADPAGTPQSDQIISRLRAQLVANALRDRGVARDRIQLRPRAAMGGAAAVERDRVEIRIGA